MVTLTAPAQEPETQHDFTPPDFTPEYIRTIKETIAKGATEEELNVFLALCRNYGLDPFLKEIWFIKRVKKVQKRDGSWDYPRLEDGSIDYSNAETIIMTSRDGLLKIAQRHPEYTGPPIGFAVCEGDEFEIDAQNYLVRHKFGAKRGRILGAWAKCDRKEKTPAIFFAPFDEYYDGYSNVWKKYRTAMIIKVAETFVLKRQFGITGLVTREELSIQEGDKLFVLEGGKLVKGKLPDDNYILEPPNPNSEQEEKKPNLKQDEEGKDKKDKETTNPEQEEKTNKPSTEELWTPEQKQKLGELKKELQIADEEINKLAIKVGIKDWNKVTQTQADALYEHLLEKQNSPTDVKENTKEPADTNKSKEPENAKEPADTKESVDANEPKEPVDAKELTLIETIVGKKANYMFVSPYGYRTAKFEDGTVGYIAAKEPQNIEELTGGKKYSLKGVFINNGEILPNDIKGEKVFLVYEIKQGG